MIVLRNDVSYDMDLVLLDDMTLLVTVLSDINISIFPYLGVTHHIEYYMAGLKYLPFATNSLESTTCPPMVLFSWSVYGEYVN